MGKGEEKIEQFHGMTIGQKELEQFSNEGIKDEQDILQRNMSVLPGRI